MTAPSFGSRMNPSHLKAASGCASGRSPKVTSPLAWERRVTLLSITSDWSSSESSKAHLTMSLASWKSPGSSSGISTSRAKCRDSPSLMLERAPGSSHGMRTMPPRVPDPARCRRKSEATFTPFCFITARPRRPANEAAAATSRAIFSFVDHST